MSHATMYSNENIPVYCSCTNWSPLHLRILHNYVSKDIGISIIETPPVSPEVKQMNVTRSPPPVNILVIDNTNIIPIQSNTRKLSFRSKKTVQKEIELIVWYFFVARRIVPATPLRSQNRKNLFKKVLSVSGNDERCNYSDKNVQSSFGLVIEGNRGVLLKKERSGSSTSLLSLTQVSKNWSSILFAFTSKY